MHAAESHVWMEVSVNQVKVPTLNVNVHQILPGDSVVKA